MSFLKKYIKRLSCIVLMLLLVVNSVSLSLEVKAAGNSSAQSAVDNICNTVGFRPNVDNYGDCYAYASAFCNKLYGSAPGGVSGYNLTRPGNFYLVGQTCGTSVTEASIASLLSQAMPGDVVQMYWDYGTGSGPHTAIIYSADSTSFTILQDGASFSTIKKSTYAYSSSYTRWKGSGYGISLYRHSNYNNLFPAYTEPPTAPTVYLNKSVLKTNETATLYWSSCDKAEYYWISCWSETEQCISEKTYGLSREISFTDPGKYSITVVSVNNKGETIGNWINIEVYEPTLPVAPTVTIDKNILKINETTTLWWDVCADADYYWISCWSETEQCISEKSYELKKEISFSEPGKYSITVVSGNDKGETIGNWISIEVYDSNGYSTIAYNSNGGTGAMSSHNVYYDSIFSLEKSTFTKNGYKQIGWNAYRCSDDMWFASGIGWETEDNITKNSWKKSVYANPIENWLFDFSWYNGGILNDTIMFYALWEKVVNETEKVLIDYDNGVIYTDVQNCSDITEFLSVSDTAEINVAESQNLHVYGTDTVIVVSEDETQVGVFTLVVNGDTNGDSVCDVLDCVDVERASNGNAELSSVYAQAGDINGDGIIDVTDYQAVVNKAIS